MAQPHPPAGAQQQYTERPIRIYGEQYLAGGPLPVGATTEYGEPPLFTDGLPRVQLPSGWALVASTDWVISNRYSGAAVEVISAEEFSERFGPGGGGAPLPTEDA